MNKKILLSAYSCEPNRGSESEVGWCWATNLANQGNEVFVITRLNQKNNIEKSKNFQNLKNLNFIYFDYPNWIIKILKNDNYSYSYLYFFLWQIGIFFKVYKLVKKVKFDYIHHVTFVSIRIPSFLCLYNVPFIFGPLSGGDTVPTNLRKNFTLKEKIKEFLRDLNNFYIRFSPLVNLNFFKAHKIYVNSENTKGIIPKIYHYKVDILLAVGYESNENLKINKILNKTFQICFIGSHINIKGLEIIYKIYQNLLINNFDFSITMIGDGPQKQIFKDKIIKNKITDKIKFLDPINRIDLIKNLSDFDLLLNPSLRDSGSMITLEAMSIGLPAAVLNLGGPGIIVDNSCGIKIDPIKKSENEISVEFSSKIINLANNIDDYKDKSHKCLEQIKKFSWINKLKYIYN